MKIHIITKLKINIFYIYLLVVIYIFKDDFLCICYLLVIVNCISQKSDNNKQIVFISIEYLSYMDVLVYLIYQDYLIYNNDFYSVETACNI
jgi:hypothetical protein